MVSWPLKKPQLVTTSSDVTQPDTDSITCPENAPPTTQDRVLDRSWRARLGVVCAGVALTADGYFNSLMSPINLVFTKEYPEVYNSTMSTRVSNALLVGQILGMLVVGLTCDFFGRKTAMVGTTLCIVVGGILATAAHGKTTEGMFWMIIVMRGVIGFGSGGEYPASSTTCAEAANDSVKHRSRAFIFSTNLPLAMGSPFCYIVFLIVWCAAGGYNHLSTVWRVCFGIGCIWPVFIFYFRWVSLNSKMFSKARFMNWKLPWLLIFRYYWKNIIAVCGTWFIYDFITFPNGIFSGLIIKSIVKDGDIKLTAEWQLLLAFLGIPGVILGAFVAEKIGRKYTLMLGFGGYLVFGLIIGCAFTQLKAIVPLFVVFYGIFNSCGNFGPGNMMGMLSTELFATPVRGTLYGLAAAVGKAGAAIGTQVFRPIQTNLGQRWTFIISALVGLAGLLVTFVFVPNRDEDDLSLEDVRFISYMRSKGYAGAFGEVQGHTVTSMSPGGSPDSPPDSSPEILPSDKKEP